MRTLVALLLLANLGFFALAQGWLQPYVGLSTLHEREPQRVAAQVDPASVRVLAAGAAQGSADCLQAGPFSAEQVDAAEAGLAQALHTAASWQRLPADAAGEWRVVLGGFADSVALSRRQESLRLQGVPSEAFGGPDPASAGLQLGHYADKAAAEAALLQWQQRGLSTAMLLAPQPTRHWLRVERPDAALRQQLQALTAAVPGGSVQSCMASR
jgi:hypothetical protein